MVREYNVTCGIGGQRLIFRTRIQAHSVREGLRVKFRWVYSLIYLELNSPAIWIDGHRRMRGLKQKVYKLIKVILPGEIRIN